MTKLVEKVAVSMEDGSMMYLCPLQKKFKKKEVMEQIERDGQYIHKDKYHIPELTAKLISMNSRGLLLSTVMCPHCKKMIIMTIHSILHEELPWCCNCSRNLYNSKDKTVLKRKW